MEATSNEGAAVLAPVGSAIVCVSQGWTEKLRDFPSELKDKNIWCVWRMISREGQSSKVPYQTRGLRAKSNDASTWCSWDEACKAADANSELGVGLFTDGTFTFVDCAHCADSQTGEIKPWAQQIVSRLSSYGEYSPSREGIHAFVVGTVGSAIKKNGVEMYSRGRFATVTGEILPNSSFALREADVGSLRQDVADGRVGTFGEKFEKLWDGDAEYIAEHYHGDESAADQAFANLLAMRFHGNSEAIEAAFSDSARGKREKWRNREDYRQRTITKAVEWYQCSTGGEKPRAESSSGWESLFHSYKDIVNAPPLRFAIEGFLQEAGITFFAGLPGHGKTLVMLNVVKALLEGGQLFGCKDFRVSHPAERILYLTPEVSLTPFRDRLRLFGLLEYVKNKRLFVRTLSAKEPLDDLKNPLLLKGVKGADVFLDTAIRFMPGDESSATANNVFAQMLFSMIEAGARSIVGAHHSPKDFAKQKNVTLENAVRGSGDIAAMLSSAWSLKQTDKCLNRIRIENIKPRDFEPCPPFEIEGRPHIEQAGAFKMVLAPAEAKSKVKDERRQRVEELTEKGWTQQAIANDLGVSRSTISKWSKNWK